MDTDSESSSPRIDHCKSFQKGSGGCITASEFRYDFHRTAALQPEVPLELASRQLKLSLMRPTVVRVARDDPSKVFVGGDTQCFTHTRVTRNHPVSSGGSQFGGS